MAEHVHHPRQPADVDPLTHAANVKTLHGPGFALLGNAAEFLDPVFSSGVTIALHSAKLGAAAVDRQLRGEAVDWQAEFAEPLMFGVETFRTFVSGWYDRSLQDVIFYPDKSPTIHRMICSVLAGYAWDPSNPYNGPQSGRRLREPHRSRRPLRPYSLSLNPNSPRKLQLFRWPNPAPRCSAASKWSNSLAACRA